MTNRGVKGTTETLATPRDPLDASPNGEVVDEPLDPALERVLRRVDMSPREPATADAALDTGPPALENGPRLRMARLARIEGGKVFLKVRGKSEDIEADVDEEVDLDLLKRSFDNGQAVLIEEEPGLLPVVVGLIQTKVPETLEIRARKIVIEGETEVLLRSGTAAMRLRQDGDVELVGSRITTMSRGLFRLVGRMLRLN